MAKKLITWLMVLTSVFLYQTRVLAASEMATSSIAFNGTASGGVLTLVEPMNRNARYISIETKAGETAESVAKRLAAAINKSDPFMWRGGDLTGRDLVHVTGNSLKGLPGNPLSGSYILAGTESGLGIPKPPLSLSCSYNPEKNQFSAYWINPPEGYDYIVILINGNGSRYPGTLTSYVFDKGGRDVNDLDICVVGYRGDIPSNAAAIHVRGRVQEELYGIPFSQGIAPNWARWSKAGGISPSQQTRTQYTAEKGKSFNPVKSAEVKPFYQVVEAGQGGGVGGVYRTFNGLIPGHTYRVTVRMAVENIENTDAISIHATYHHDKELTVDQLAGIASLPNGNFGVQAEALARYDSKHVPTKGKFVSLDKDITLPAGVHYLTVWLRCDTKLPARVALDWLSLEDLSL